MGSVIVIPAYNPDRALPDLVRRLLETGNRVVVVDDGSMESCQPVFERLRNTAVVLHHPFNRGKGAAIKTALAFIREEMWEEQVIGIMDCDGQHLPDDMRKVTDCAMQYPDTLVLGVRDVKQMPAKSKLGNTVTRVVFKGVSGLWITDTQTGMRAFSAYLAEKMLEVPGDRYEYETNVLLALARNGTKIREVGISTVYHDSKNSCSHFHVIKDSVMIYKDLLKFSMTSLSGFVLDYVLFVLFHRLLGGTESGTVTANVLARLISAGYNYEMNTKHVFRQKRCVRTAAQYALLAMGILAGNCLLLAGFEYIGTPVYVAKLLTELILFVLSFTVQKQVIYRKERKFGSEMKKKLFYLGRDILIAVCCLCVWSYTRFYRAEAVTQIPQSAVTEEDLASGASGGVSGSMTEELLNPGNLSYVTYKQANPDAGIRILDRYQSPDGTLQAETFRITDDRDGSQEAIYVTDIRTTDVHSIKAALAQGAYGANLQEPPKDILKAAGGVLGISGDNYGMSESGVVVRNGQWLRTKTNQHDICVLFEDGTMETYPASEYQEETVRERGAWQIWTFGPALLPADCALPESYTTYDYIKEVHPRCAIGYIAPGHYLFIVVDGRQEGYSEGLDLYGLSAVCKELGCVRAYNLDGGGSAAMITQDEAVNRPCKEKEGRPICDIIYFAEGESYHEQIS